MNTTRSRRRLMVVRVASAALVMTSQLLVPSMAVAQADSDSTDVPSSEAAPSAAATPTTTSAGPEGDRARQLLLDGTNAINSGDYETARGLLLEAYALMQSYDIAAALGQAELALGRHAEAARHLRLALRQFPPSESLKLKQRVLEGYQKAKREVGSVKLLVSPSDAEVLVDGESQGMARELPPELFLAAGRHELSARLGERTVRETLVAEPGQDYNLTLALNETPEAATGASPEANDAWQGESSSSTHDVSSGPERSWVPVVVGGAVSALALGTGIVLSVSAGNQRDEMRRLRDEHGSSGCSGSGGASLSACDAQRDAAESADRRANFATVSYALAGVGVVATVGYWLLTKPTSERQAARRPALDASVSAEGAALSISGTF